MLQRRDGAAQVGMTRDLCRGGVGFVTGRPVATGEALDLELLLPGEDGPVRMAVEVAWCRPYGEGVRRCGARLRTISVRDAMRLKAHMGIPRPHRAAS